MPIPKVNKYVTPQEALQNLSHELQTVSTTAIGGFYDFVRNIWAKSYEHPEYFDAWHIGLVCEDVEKCIEQGLNYVGILPRYHFKSTIIGYAFSIWRLLKMKTDANILYLSYSDGMAQYHISEINKRVRRNSRLSELMQDRSPTADYSFRYYANKKRLDILHGGLFSFKRGVHTNAALIADDILRDPENPLNFSQLDKIENHFMTESMFIPSKGAPVIVLGTPMAPNDLLTKLKSDERFFVRALPALNPTPNRRVLMPELYDEKWLLTTQKSRPESFASEFMLTPYSSAMAYISEDKLREVEKSDLQSLNVRASHADLVSDYTIAGFDIGKKRHPSHLVIYSSSNGIMKQVHQSFLDGWDYSAQVQLLNDVVKNFDVDKGYLDNTRGELEDRGLLSIWEPMVFTEKSKRKMAQVFEEYVLNKKIEMISDARQRSQIACVNTELQAPETPLGHGDSFWSNALAVFAHYESHQHQTTLIGDLQLDTEETIKDPLTKHIYEAFTAIKTTNFISVCPQCNESKGWIPENRLCLICSYRDKK